MCFKSDVVATGSQCRECRNGMVWKNLEKLKTGHIAVICSNSRSKMVCGGSLV